MTHFDTINNMDSLTCRSRIERSQHHTATFPMRLLDVRHKDVVNGFPVELIREDVARTGNVYLLKCQGVGLCTFRDHDVERHSKTSVVCKNKPLQVHTDIVVVV